MKENDPLSDDFWLGLGAQLGAQPEREAAVWAAGLNEERTGYEARRVQLEKKKRIYGRVVLVVTILLMIFPLAAMAFLLGAVVVGMSTFKQEDKIEVRRLGFLEQLAAGLAGALRPGSALRCRLDKQRVEALDQEASQTPDQRWLEAAATLSDGSALAMELALHIEERRERRTEFDVGGPDPSRARSVSYTVYSPQERLSIRVDLARSPAAWAALGPGARAAAIDALRERLRAGASLWLALLELEEGPEGAPQLRLRFSTEVGELERMDSDEDKLGGDTGFMPPALALRCVEIAAQICAALSAPEPEQALAAVAPAPDSASSASEEALEPGEEAMAGLTIEERPVEAHLAELDRRFDALRSGLREGLRWPISILVFPVLFFSAPLSFAVSLWALIPLVLSVAILVYLWRSGPADDPRRLVLPYRLLEALSEELPVDKKLGLGLEPVVDTDQSQAWLYLKASLRRGRKLSLLVALEHKPGSEASSRRLRAREQLWVEFRLREPPTEEALQSARLALEEADDMQLAELSAEERRVKALLYTRWGHITEDELKKSMKGEGAVDGVLRSTEAARLLKALLSLSASGVERW